MCFPGRGTHITRDMCFSGRGHKSLGICVSQVEEHISLGICVSQVGEHISLGIQNVWRLLHLGYKRHKLRSYTPLHVLYVDINPEDLTLSL